MSPPNAEASHTDMTLGTAHGNTADAPLASDAKGGSVTCKRVIKKMQRPSKGRTPSRRSAQPSRLEKNRKGDANRGPLRGGDNRETWKDRERRPSGLRSRTHRGLCPSSVRPPPLAGESLILWRFLFVHQNFPPSSATSRDHLAQQHGFRCTFVSRAGPPAASPTASDASHRTRPRGGATKHNHYCSRTFENAVWHTPRRLRGPARRGRTSGPT